MVKYVFLDTNIYISARYSFANPYFKKLSELVAVGNVILLSCSTCTGEVEKHIRNDLGNAIKELNKVLKMSELAAVRNEDLYRERLAKLDAEETANYVINKFRDYLLGNHTKMFSLEGISVEEVMNDYFEQNAPFEKKKPNEFKDAIMIKALKKYQKEINENVAVISNDIGFRQAFSVDNGFIVFEKLADFLQYFQRADEIQVAFEQYFEEDLGYDDMQQELSDWAENACYSYDEREEFEVIQLWIDDITYDLDYTEVTDNGTLQAYMTVYFSTKIQCQYLDLDNSYYDKEDDDYIVKSYIEAVEIHRFECEIIMEFGYLENDAEAENPEDKYEIMFIGISDETDNSSIDLSEDTLWDCLEEQSVMSEKDSLWFENNVVKCSECGKVLGFNDDGNYHDYCGEPLCNECAVTNDKGFICPMCGFKHPYDRMSNSGERCIDCEQEYDY